MTAGETCFIVPLDDDFAQPGGTYALMWIDPGDLFIALFTDGFESGDTSAASSVTP